MPRVRHGRGHNMENDAVALHCIKNDKCWAVPGKRSTFVGPFSCWKGTAIISSWIRILTVRFMIIRRDNIQRFRSMVNILERYFTFWERLLHKVKLVIIMCRVRLYVELDYCVENIELSWVKMYVLELSNV